ncbi:hypothetical protein HETIRDRAFT_458745 [Heterobasidion irregulare TC 32-1]|uniref:Uncharacterized protein n=1 Tax=Heterobasidion irregulare (strain TC 32-1) TaxID=747525 RepID=W4KCC0_HETIT|nr:uncharacterized protein HETIRDRAFT_458745 [Heterobasidion irregulare TC 32-1]ETW83413.1 hypothetical protein HETIRDRAFT_458745 [Heterobasidion irregulare TC 32-1]
MGVECASRQEFSTPVDEPEGRMEDPATPDAFRMRFASSHAQTQTQPASSSSRRKSSSPPSLMTSVPAGDLSRAGLLARVTPPLGPRVPLTLRAVPSDSSARRTGTLRPELGRADVCRWASYGYLGPHTAEDGFDWGNPNRGRCKFGALGHAPDSEDLCRAGGWAFDLHVSARRARLELVVSTWSVYVLPVLREPSELLCMRGLEATREGRSRLYSRGTSACWSSRDLEELRTRMVRRHFWVPDHRLMPTNHRYRVPSLLRQTNVNVASHVLPLEVRALFSEDLDAVSPTAAGEGVIVDT